MVERSPHEWEVVCSIPDRVIPKTLKIVSDASLLSAQHIRSYRSGFSRTSFNKL